MPILSPDDVRRVVKLDGEPVLRNLLITQGYHDLSEAMRSRTGRDGINWCTLGTWASKTAGEFIRNDEIPKVFLDLLEKKNVFGKVAAAFDPLKLLELVRRIIDDVSTYIMTGNRVVFAELAQVFADFLAALGSDTSPDPARLRRFQETLSDGEPEPDITAWDPDRRAIVVKTAGGQGKLREMVANYYAAMFEKDPKRRAELLLLANAQGGIHEQTRLQPYIAGSIDAPLTETLLAHTHDHVEQTVATAPLRAGLHAFVDTTFPAIGRAIEKLWEEFSTVEMMKLTLPDGVIRLGYPIPQEGGERIIPSDLVTIENPALRALLADYDALERLHDGIAKLLGHDHTVTKFVLAAAAHDWVDYRERMRFIMALFRSRAEDGNLTAQPFTATQLADIRSGRLPVGPM